MTATLDADLRATAERCPAKVAVASDGHGLTYAQLDARATAVACRLQVLGVGRGDRVAVVMRSRAAMAAALYGVIRAGAVVVPISATASPHRRREMLRRCDASAAVADTDVASAVGEELPGRCPVLDASALEGDSGSAPPRRAAALPALSETDIASIIFTSGSTGESKGAVFLHGDMHFLTGSVLSYLGLCEHDRVLSVLPLSHTYGLYQLLMSVRVGATLRLRDGLGLPSELVEALLAERITVLPGVPTMWHVLLGRGGLTTHQLPDLRLLTNAGGLLPLARINDLRQALPSALFFSMYGQTECARACYLPPGELARRPESVGVPVPGTSAWIEGPNGSVLGPGEIGELVVRGEHVMRCYWNDPGATSDKVRPAVTGPERVLRTGDLFRCDDDGFFYFVSRKDDIIKFRGEKVAPRVVEEALCTAKGVREAVVVGVADALLGQVVVAHVSVAEGSAVDPVGLRRHCATLLEEYEVPRRFVLHDRLPTLENGKFDRMALVAWDGGATGAPALHR